MRINYVGDTGWDELPEDISATVEYRRWCETVAVWLLDRFPTLDSIHANVSYADPNLPTYFVVGVEDGAKGAVARVVVVPPVFELAPFSFTLDRGWQLREE